jgi:tetratricopeptide (TPR) repeat protein
LLEELPLDHPDRPQIYNNLGYTYQKMGRHAEALHQLNISIDLYSKPNACNFITNFNRKLACAYNNKGLVHGERGEFTAALEYINKSLDLRHDDVTLSEKQRNRLAVERSYCHENLGLHYKDISEYELALHHLQEALNIRNEKLPSNHHSIAQVYNNLGRVYTLVGSQLKAFECVEQALTRQIQALPNNHPHRGTMYNTLGEAYFNQGKYPMAFLNFKKALELYQAARTLNPLLEVIALSNMGSVMKAQENFDGALQTFLQALPIIEREKPCHPDVARALNNIGFAYSGKRDSKTAIVYFTRALDFCRKHLTENNELTAISYLSLASEFAGEQYDLAMKYFQRVISIYDHIGLPHHINVIRCHAKQGLFYCKLHDHHSALSCYEKALFHCREASLPQQHPLWVQVYTNFAREYYLMSDYHQALEKYERALHYTTEESLEIPRIYASMDLCRRKIIEVDVLQTMTLLLDEVAKSLSDD